MASDELPGPVQQRIAAGHHWPALQVIIEILLELVDRQVTVARVLSQSHREYVVQISTQSFPQPFGGRVTATADFFGSITRIAYDGDARTRRFLLADDSSGFPPCRLQPVWAASGQ